MQETFIAACGVCAHENDVHERFHHTDTEEPKMEDPIAELIKNYNELNSCVIEEFHEEPSALEFMRFVARNTPFVVRGAALDWEATRTWNISYLKEVLGDEPVNIAVTPAGYLHIARPCSS